MYFHIVNQITMLGRVCKLLLVCLLCTSCDYFSSQKSTATTTIQLLPAVVDFTSVTKYPLFPDCNDAKEDGNRKECFETSITQKLTELLAKHELRVDREVNDKVSIDILIDLTNRASLVRINSPQIITKELPNLEEIIRESIRELPPIEPARKNGMRVKSQYRMEIIIQMI